MAVLDVQSSKNELWRQDVIFSCVWELSVPVILLLPPSSDSKDEAYGVASLLILPSVGDTSLSPTIPLHLSTWRPLLLLPTQIQCYLTFFVWEYFSAFPRVSSSILYSHSSWSCILYIFSLMCHSFPRPFSWVQTLTFSSLLTPHGSLSGISNSPSTDLRSS